MEAETKKAIRMAMDGVARVANTLNEHAEKETFPDIESREFEIMMRNIIDGFTDLNECANDLGDVKIPAEVVR